MRNLNYEEMKQELIRAARAAGLQDYEIYSTEDTAESVKTYRHEISQFSSETAQGVSFRCSVRGKVGYAATESFTKDEAERLVSAASENAALIEGGDEAIFHAAGDCYEQKTKEAGQFPQTKDLIHLALDCHEAAYAKNELVADGTQSRVTALERTIRLYNSRGLDLTNRIGYTAAYVTAIVKKDGEMYDGSEFEAASVDAVDACELAGRAVKKAVSAIGAAPVKTGTYPVVFDNSQMGALLAAFFPVFSAEKTQKGLSLLKDREGTSVASECVTITDHPFYPDSAVQAPFDDEGVATREKKVIENGVLKTLLHNLKTAGKAGTSSTGNASRAGYAGTVTIAPYTFYLEPGTKSKEELFTESEGGIYITEIKGMHAGANAVTGDFSLECKGFLIRNGAADIPVKAFTIAGSFFELLKKITAVGTDLAFGMPRGTTCFGAPGTAVSEVSVAGE